MQADEPHIPNTNVIPATARSRSVRPWDEAVLDHQSVPPWRRHLAALLRYRWAVLLVTALGTAGGAVATRFVKPQYRVAATVWIDVQRPGVVANGPIGGRPLLDATAWIDLMQSYVVLDPVVEELALHVRPLTAGAAAPTAGSGDVRPGRYRVELDRGTVTVADDDGRVVEQRPVGDSIGRAIGLGWAPSEAQLAAAPTMEIEVVSVRDAARDLRAQLDVRTDLLGTFLTVQLAGQDPRRITTIVNAVAAQFVRVADQMKRAKHAELSRILADQLERAREQLDEAEEALARFRHTSGFLPAGTAGGAEDRRIGAHLATRLERDELRRDRDAIERIVAGGGGARPVEGLALVPMVQRSPALARALDQLTEVRAERVALQARYTDAHPAVQRLAEEAARLERDIVPTLAAQFAAQLRDQERTMTGWLDSAAIDLRRLPVERISDARLERAAQLAAELYTTVRRRYDESRLAEASSLPDARILETALVPGRPAENAAPRILLMALFGSLGLAVLGALARGRADRRVHFPEQVSWDMGLPILGAIPSVRGSGRALTRDDVAEHVEALRAIRLSLAHAHGASTPMMFTITSPSVGDGKSFVTSRLALAFADAGYRTLLLDGDVRRGRLHATLGRRRQPGLIDHLEGRVPIAELVQSTDYGPLDFIACGRRSPGGPELLGTPAMRDLLATLRTQYEVVLVDSAPVGAAVDPLVLGMATTNLVLVLRSGVTDAGLTAAKLETLDRLPLRVVGAILNDVGSGHRDHMYAYYLPGYEVEEEEGARNA